MRIAVTAMNAIETSAAAPAAIVKGRHSRNPTPVIAGIGAGRADATG
jgi:hypothetical protein